jgi:hypothetical protein
MEEAPGIVERIAAEAGRPRAAAAMALWAAAEAIVLPIVPDVGLGILALAAPGRTWRLFGAVLAGAVAGTLVLGVLAARAPDAVAGMLVRVPGIDAAMVDGTRAELERDGVAGFAQVGIGPPLKVYTAEWLAGGGDGPGLVVGAVLNRLTRIGPAVIVAAVVGRLLAGRIRRHAGLVLGAYAVFWAVVYAVVLTG